GKVILLGEHVVVHGQPAIVASVERGVRVTVVPRPAGEVGVALAAADERLQAAAELAARLCGVGRAGFQLEVEGDLPVAMGLGSSAALAVAVLRALSASAGRELGDAQLASSAHEIERLFHGTPSGVDSTAAAHGGVLWFESGRRGEAPRQEAIELPEPLPLLVLLSRTPHTTATTVGGLRERAAASPEVYQPVFAAVGALVASARRALEDGDRARLGELMTMNHGLLRACGVSTPELDAIVDAALGAGALGAKLTGAGGGGAVIALPADDGAALLAALRARGHDGFVARLGVAGRADVC
ncbi:MAG: mevalonate kinase, partial [Thermodesulfobacteriota bacterium]